jgi:transketolase
MDQTEKLRQIARVVRATCIQMAADARESHVSSALSCVDLLTVLFGGFLRGVDRCDILDPQRDRFILSKGHGCSALYAAMAAYNLMPASLLKEYSATDGALPNHPCKHALGQIEVSSGSLGHGLGIATGMLYGLRLSDNTHSRAVVLMSDGECNEGSVWEAAMFAAAQKFSNLIAIVDNNGTQAVGSSDALMGYTSLEEKFRSFGWHAITIDGNDVAEVAAAFKRIPFSADKPSAIIARTKTGAGVSFIENRQEWFYRTPNVEDVQKALAEIGVAPLR